MAKPTAGWTRDRDGHYRHVSGAMVVRYGNRDRRWAEAVRRNDGAIVLIGGLHRQLIDAQQAAVGPAPAVVELFARYLGVPAFAARDRLRQLVADAATHALADHEVRVIRAMRRRIVAGTLPRSIGAFAGPQLLATLADDDERLRCMLVAVQAELFPARFLAGLYAGSSR